MQRLLLAAALLCGVVIGFAASGHVAPSTAHLIFVPSVLLLGIVLGFVLGGRAARDEGAARAVAEEAKAARRAAREAARKPAPPAG
ncbi:MAG: hypothetical protein EXR72_16380 [Myxococcales bacterium]|nr:hypothetical protein [Myxococcales bacterium]